MPGHDTPPHQGGRRSQQRPATSWVLAVGDHERSWANVAVVREEAGDAVGDGGFVAGADGVDSAAEFGRELTSRASLLARRGLQASFALMVGQCSRIMTRLRLGRQERLRAAMKNETSTTQSGNSTLGPGLSEVASAFVPQAVPADDPDALVRAAAFAKLDEIVAAYGPTVSWSVLKDGFRVGGAAIFFASRAEGIFKPRQMRSVLSIKTTIPRPGRLARYADQSQTGGFVSGSIGILYDFKGTDPFDPQNQLLWEAHLRRLPLIYFFGVGPSLYEVVAPVFIESWMPSAQRCS